MTEKMKDPGALTVALLTVHVDRETVERIRQTASDMPWELVHVDYENYFSAAKLPPLTQRAINTQACVAVVDFDVHHGNGTQDIFWMQPRVLYASTHQSPLYPGTGAPDETGAAGELSAVGEGVANGVAAAGIAGLTGPLGAATGGLI